MGTPKWVGQSHHLPEDQSSVGETGTEVLKMSHDGANSSGEGHLTELEPRKARL